MLAAPPSRVNHYASTATAIREEARSSFRTVRDRLQVSGTQLRKWLSEGSAVPAEFSRPEVLEILRAYYASLEAHGQREVKLEGHPAR